MKLRIKGNSLRIRVTRPEVDRLAVDGFLQEQSELPGNTLTYVVRTADNVTELSAHFDDNVITMFVPAIFAKEWTHNNIVGIDTDASMTGNSSLHLLLEKDFMCTNETVEDQSEHYENPKNAL
jgi:hypothetical protein